MHVTTTPTIPHHGHSIGTLRPGGPSAPPASSVVAQAVVELPRNFGAHANIDVSTGATLGTFQTIEDARIAVRQLAQDGRPTVGLLQHYDGTTLTYSAAELLVPDFTAAPIERADGSPVGTHPGWSTVRPTALRMGRDEQLGGRFIEELWLVQRDGELGARLVEVATRGGTLEFEFVHPSGGARSRFNEFAG